MSDPLFSTKTAEELLGRPEAPFKTREKRNGGWITFPNGWTVSIQWGGGNYCANYEFPIGGYPAPDSPTAEIAIWRNKHADLQEWEDGDTVQGYLTWDEVQHVLDLCERDEILQSANRTVAGR